MLKIIVLTLFSFSCFAEFSYLNRSQQALLMGDAFTAVADDENTLFYNPAALGRHSGVSLSLFKPNFEFPDIVQKDIGFDGFNLGLSDRFEDWPNEPAAITDRILGFPLYLQVGATPTIKVGSFGLSLFAVSKTNMVLENAIHPILDLSYRLDRGFIMGYAFGLGKKPKGKKGNGHFSSLGISLKSVNRQGLEGDFDLFGTELLEIISNSDSYKEIRRNLGYSKGSGFGLDLGWESNYYAGNTRMGFGVSLLDVGGTKFKKSEGISEVPDQEMSLNTGLAFEQKFGFFDYTLSADYHNVIDPYTPAISKLKLGARLDFPIVDLFMGWNGGYMSYGLGVEAFFFKIMLGFYGIEIGQKFRQREGERVVLSISLLEFHFDQF